MEHWFLLCFTMFYLHFPTCAALLLDSIFLGVPGVKRTLGEVKVQRSDVAAVCENVGVATSFPPGNHRSHCCYSSRWVTHKEHVFLLVHTLCVDVHTTVRWGHLQMYIHQNTDIQLCTAIQGWRKVNNERSRLIKQTCTPH